MNIEQTKEAIRVMQAFVDGKEVEVEVKLLNSSCWIPAETPCWDWNSCIWRIKPTAKLRPWTADEVPLGAWMRFKLLPSTRLIISDVTLSINFKQWLDEREHSTDGGVTWKPCGVVEESK